MEALAIAVFVSSFILCISAVYSYIKWNSKKEFVIGIDINKESKPKVPESGGIPVLASLWALFALFSFFGIISINLNSVSWMILITAFSAIGFLDDRKHKFLSKAVPWLVRALPIAIISLLFSYFAFSNNIIIAILGAVFVAAVASFHNTFAGLNGWEVGSSFIISCFVSFLLKDTQYFPIALMLSGCIFALLAFNRYPAKVFPGDSGTLLFGSAIAGLLLLNKDIRIIAIAMLFYIPHAIDFFALKMLTNAKDASQSKIKPYAIKGGKIAMPEYEGMAKYDFAKLLVRIFGPMEEWKIVLFIWALVIFNCSLWIAAFQAF